MIIKLTALDKRILNRLQKNVPIMNRPWEAIAAELDIKEDFLLKRIAFFKKKGIIRRINAVFAPRKIGFASTLVAAKIAPEKLKIAVKKINSFPEVTHNYGRSGEYNIWFTLVAQNKRSIARIISTLKKEKDIKKITEFPTVKLFKIDVNFEV